MRRRIPAILGTAAAVLVGLPVAFVVFAFFTGKAYRIPSSAMEPTLHCARPGVGCAADQEDKVFVWKPLYWFGGPGRGDLVVFKSPTAAEGLCGAAGTFVKRVIALPGETFEERKGFVYVDGKRLEEPYVKADRRDTRTEGPTKIPRGRYFVLGDNRVQSCDSREWGSVPRKSIIGKVFLVYWPLGRFGLR